MYLVFTNTYDKNLVSQFFIIKLVKFICVTYFSVHQNIPYNTAILNFLFRILVRAISYTVHGLIPASCVFADRYNREEVVRSLGKEVNINPPLMLGQLPDTPEELLKLDQVSKKVSK